MSWRRRPHPTEPDRNDERRALAERLYADARGYLERGEGIPPVISATIFWIGYRVWMLPNNGFTPPDTPRRREKLFREAAFLPYAADVRGVIEGLGWNRPPNREAEVKFERLERFVSVEGDVVSWGLEDTRERALIFGARYDILRLRVEDGGETVFSEDHRPLTEGAWSFSASLKGAGLTDDDYRFVLECLHSGGGSRSRHPFDFAIVEGEWKRLEYQGYDWDGESEHSLREHVEGLAPPAVPLTPPEAPDPSLHAPKGGEEASEAEAPEKPKGDPRLIAEARENFNRRHTEQGGGADWYMTLVAYGEKPIWKASSPAPESTNIVAHLKARARLWSGWRRWAADLERIGA